MSHEIALISLDFGRSRGGLGTKINAVIDHHGMPVRIVISQGQPSDKTIARGIQLVRRQLPKWIEAHSVAMRAGGARRDCEQDGDNTSSSAGSAVSAQSN